MSRGRGQRQVQKGCLARIVLKCGNGRSDVFRQYSLEPKGNHVDSHADGRKDGTKNAEFPRLADPAGVGGIV